MTISLTPAFPAGALLRSSRLSLTPSHPTDLRTHPAAIRARTLSPTCLPFSNHYQQSRGVEYYDKLSGYSYDSSSVHVPDTRSSFSHSRDANMHHGGSGGGTHTRDGGGGGSYRDIPSHAGPTEAGFRGAVSAQALSALLAGLQSHGVNLTSGPPPPLPPVAASGLSKQSNGGEALFGASSGEEQYVLLPDGMVGLVHTIVKPAVLQPKLTALGQVTPPPHAVPLVLLPPGGVAGAAADGGTAAAIGGPWGPLPYTYGCTTPFFPATQMGMYSGPYPFQQRPYAYPGQVHPMSFAMSPHPSSGQGAASAEAPAPPPSPPYISPHHGPEGYYYRHQVPQPGHPLGSQGGADAQHLHELQTHTHVVFRPDGAGVAPARGSSGAGGPTNDGGGSGSGPHRGGGLMSSRLTSLQHPSGGSSAATGLSSGTEPVSGNGSGGSGLYTGGVYTGGRYHHRHSHSGAESLRSLPSNSGGSLRGGGPGSLSLSQQYEPTLASPSPRESLQNLVRGT